MSIKQATALIADIDPAAARMFANKPFHRRNIAKAFCQALMNSCYRDWAIKNRIETTLNRAIDNDIEMRKLMGTFV